MEEILVYLWTKINWMPFSVSFQPYERCFALLCISGQQPATVIFCICLCLFTHVGATLERFPGTPLSSIGSAVNAKITELRSKRKTSTPPSQTY